MNGEFEINLSDEELEKIRNILINNKGLRHYGFQRENGEYLDLVEYKDYEKLQSNWNSLKEWLEKQKHDTEICKEWNRKNNFNDIDYDRDVKRFDFILDKMNELEGNDKK